MIKCNEETIECNDLLAGDSYIFKSIELHLLAVMSPQPTYGWISWLAGRIMKNILEKHQKEQICFVKHFETKSFADQYTETTPQSISCPTS